MGLLRRKKKGESESGFSAQQSSPAEKAPPAAEARRLLEATDVEQVTFRLAFRGYNERDVDEFLELVTADVGALHEENARLRKESEVRDDATSPDEAKRHAEETVRRAREEAARIIREAEGRSRAAAVADSPPRAYLVREREFLTRLASLLQDHASFLRMGADTGAPPAPKPPPEPEATAPMPPVEEAKEVVGPEGLPSPFAPPEAEEPPAAARPAEASREGEDESTGPAEAGAARTRPAPPPPGQPDEEPSLRELFWGEE